MSAFIQARSIQIGGAAVTPTNGTLRGVHLSFWMVLIAGVLLCALFGVIIGAPTLRLRSDYLAIVTLAFGEIIASVLHEQRPGLRSQHRQRPQGHQPRRPHRHRRCAGDSRGAGEADDAGSRPAAEVRHLRRAHGPVIFVSLRIREGKLGRAWLAIREDELAASMMGVPLMRTKLAAYAVGAATGGLGGVAFATHVNGVFADRFNFSVSIILLAMVVLGGMGNVWGRTARSDHARVDQLDRAAPTR
jgi:branched-chain amino acid transport system permease protein